MEIAILIITLIAIVIVAITAKKDNSGRQAKSTARQTSPATASQSNRATESIVRTPTDTYEGSFWELKTTYSSDAKLKLNYVDAEGSKTERTVDVSGFGKDGSVGYFTGYCRIRNEPRTFRYDRVKECIDIETGEIIEDVHAYLLRRYESSPTKAMDIMQTDNADILRMLFFIGKADGSLRAPERAVILATCHRFTGDRRITDDLLQKYLRSTERPTDTAFKMAVERIKNHIVDKRAWIIDAAERIVATQITVHPDEARALEYMRLNLSHTN